MAKSEQQRQKKLAKKRVKELQSRRQLAQTKQQLSSLFGQMQAVSGGQIHGCYISRPVGNGMVTVLLGRRLAGGRVGLAFFLLDLLCLGVKDAGGRLGSASEFATVLERMGRNNEMLPASPSTARKLVESAIEFARSVGFEPHPDYRKVAPLWGDIDPAASNEEFTFGEAGKPVFVAGPFDDPPRQQWILQRLRETVGEGNFNFALAMGPGTHSNFLSGDPAPTEKARLPGIE